MKPTSLKIRDLKEKLVNVINESDLPVCIIDLIFKEALTQISSACSDEYFYDLEQYKNESKDSKE